MDNTIYGMIPVNKTAGIVTSQSGCEDKLTNEQSRDNLVSKKKVMEQEMLSYPKKHPKRIELGYSLQEINMQINSMRPKRKSIGVESHFINVAREHLSKFEFSRWMDMANDRLRSSEKQ